MKVTKPRQARRPMVSLAAPGQLASPPRQQRAQPRREKRWKVAKLRGIKVVLRSCRPHQDAPSPQALLQAPPQATQQVPPKATQQAPLQTPSPAKEQTPAPSVPALALASSLKVQRRPEEEFEDPLADAMGFGGPPPPTSCNYYTVPAYATFDDDAARAALLGFPVPLAMDSGLVTRPQTRSPDPGEWNEADPAPGFTQVMDAPDLSTIFESEPQQERGTSFLDMTGWRPQDFLLPGTLWEELSWT